MVASTAHQVRFRARELREFVLFPANRRTPRATGSKQDQIVGAWKRVDVAVRRRSVLESVGMETTKATVVQAYYAPLHGKWHCEFEFAITDERALRDATMSAFDRLRLRSTVWMSKLLGPCTMNTTLDYETSGDAGVIFHTTRVSKWGITLLSSEESFTVEPNGRDFAMRGSQRMIPTYWHAQSFGEGRGSVDESATRATYSFTWMGGPMLQETVSTKDTVTMTQTTPFSRGVQRLRRIGT